jgi:hypothetical protein
MAKKELGLDVRKSYPISLLLDSLERIPLLCQSEEYHNILWQLKGFALIREFLGKPRYSKFIKGININ